MMWPARHSTVLVPLVWAPTPRWQAVPKDWIPEAVLAHSKKALIGGRVAKEANVYNRGYALKVSTAMKDTMEAKHSASKLRL